MTGKIHLRIGKIDVECEASEDFLSEGLPRLIAEVVKLQQDSTDGDGKPENGNDNDTTDGFVKVTGKVSDYFSGNPLARSDLQTLGLETPISVRTSLDGTFEINLPKGEAVIRVIAEHSDAFLPTVNELLLRGTSELETNVQIVASADVTRQYATLALQQQPVDSLIIIDLRAENGEALEGLSPTDITLLNGEEALIGEGPFFFDASGDVTTPQTLPQSQAFDNRARAAFLNVPEGNHQLTVRFLINGESETISVQVIVIQSGVSLVFTAKSGSS